MKKRTFFQEIIAYEIDTGKYFKFCTEANSLQNEFSETDALKKPSPSAH